MSSLLGGKGLEPFYSLLEGGREGDFFRELEEYFYYAQIRRFVVWGRGLHTLIYVAVIVTTCIIYVYVCHCYFYSQGVDTTATREVSTTVPIEQIPDIMRGIGFYPSEEEVCFI